MTTKDKGITLPVYPAIQFKGTLVLGAAVSTTVNNVNVTATSHLDLSPTNAAAATLMGSAKALYVSAKVAGTSFTVSTANGTAAAGTETFDYILTF